MSGKFQDDALVFYDLTNKRGGHLSFSPHCVKTVVDLKLLGITKHTHERLTFVQVRNDLAKNVCDDVTVPTLKIPDGSCVVDSFKIAEWLDENHPEGAKIFGGSEEGKRVAAFVNTYVKNILGNDIGALSKPHIAPLLDEESREYFINVKNGKDQFEEWSSASPAQRKEHIDSLIRGLAPIEAMLAAKPRKDNFSRPTPNWLAGGPEPTHADACLFGWYVFSRADPSACKAVWESEWLPEVGKWVRAMLEWCGPDIVGEFVAA
ncbi:hypothetical protein A4X13_0g6727 [Tilletia indica]|uniref:Uncharacterized protein n=1 Tax=Tilletia indica TaxID=43049 RepID=A0A177T7F0_9BASI|nr:hypothetical protein A4X13_0g6727 [Tilletia indica]